MLARDDSAWTEFVLRFRSLMISRVVSACQETGLTTNLDVVAGEISAEIYAMLIENEMKVLRSFSGRSRLSTWLAVIVRRQTLRYLTHLRRQPLSIDPEICRDVRAVVSEVSRQEQLTVKTNVARTLLSSGDQEVLRLFYDEELPYAEIAVQLGISVNAVGPKLDRARRRLRRAIN
jgi:RNA polymerase sigma-70 factor, ECF subfamily